ncbi:hypothetical protein HK096_003949 [Nowakowskiella sp. JEL0078]|nr:hypothetical protein HK096_003949 [Nowakowskiella sp. JEL0078]
MANRFAPPSINSVGNSLSVSYSSRSGVVTVDEVKKVTQRAESEAAQSRWTEYLNNDVGNPFYAKYQLRPELRRNLKPAYCHISTLLNDREIVTRPKHMFWDCTMRHFKPYRSVIYTSNISDFCYFQKSLLTGHCNGQLWLQKDGVEDIIWSCPSKSQVCKIFYYLTLQDKLMKTSKVSCLRYFDSPESSMAVCTTLGAGEKSGMVSVVRMDEQAEQHAVQVVSGGCSYGQSQLPRHLGELLQEIKMWDTRFARSPVLACQGHANSLGTKTVDIDEGENVIVAVGEDGFLRTWSLQNLQQTSSKEVNLFSKPVLLFTFVNAQFNSSWQNADAQFNNPVIFGKFRVNSSLSQPAILSNYNNSFSVNNGRYKVGWFLTNTSSSNPVVHILLASNFSAVSRSSDSWAYMSLAVGTSMLHANFIMARYKSGKCWLSEHYSTMSYTPPILVPDLANLLVTPVSCSWNNPVGFWTVEFTRPMNIPAGDKFGRSSWSTSHTLDNVLISYQLNSKSSSDYHTETQRATLTVNWVTGYFNVVAAPRIQDKVIHGIGMMVCWLLVLPAGVFYARYFKFFHLILIHASIQAAGASGVLAFFIFNLVIVTIHFAQTHSIFGLVIIILIVFQGSLGILNRIGLQFESIAAFRPYVRVIHDKLGLILLISAAIQIALGLNITFPFFDLGGTGNNTRPGGEALWYIYFFFVGFWILLFFTMEVVYFLRIRQSDPALKSQKKNEKKGGEKKDGYAEKNYELDPLALAVQKVLSNEDVYKKTPMQQIALTNAEEKSSNGLRKFTWKELDEKIVAGDMYVVANGRYIYEISQWINSHPGGQIILNAVNGTDITSDYFHEAGFDATEHLPKKNNHKDAKTRTYTPIPVASEFSRENTIRNARPTSAQWRSVEQLANIEYARYFTETEWSLINKSRRPHLHTRNAIEKLSSLIIGELSKGDKDKEVLVSTAADPECTTIVQFSPFEYRRYAMTGKSLVSGLHATSPVYKLRFCLLYPFTTGADTEEFSKLLLRPFYPGQCIEMQITILAKGLEKRRIESRYYTTVSGNLMAFEIIVKIKRNGLFSPWLAKQRVGERQFKVRGPWGTPLIVGPQNPVGSEISIAEVERINELVTTHDRIIFFTAGSGISPFLQFVKWAILPEFVPLEVLQPWNPSQPDELNLVPGDFVAVRTHLLDGWAIGINLSTNNEGVFPLAITSPPFPRVLPNSAFLKSTRFISLHHCVATVDDIFGVDILEGTQLAYSAEFVAVKHYVSGGKFTGQVAGEIVGRKIEEADVIAVAKAGYQGLGFGSSKRERPVFVVCGPGAFSGLVWDGLRSAGVPDEEIIGLSESTYI